jgi:hypothetical protein
MSLTCFGVKNKLALKQVSRMALLNKLVAWAQRLTSIILATRESEIRKISNFEVQSQQGKKLMRLPSQAIKSWAYWCAPVIPLCGKGKREECGPGWPKQDPIQKITKAKKVWECGSSSTAPV